MIQLDIPKTTTSVSEIFRVLEKEKENYNILYYTVSQNTLETVRKAILLHELEKMMFLMTKKMCFFFYYFGSKHTLGVIIMSA